MLLSHALKMKSENPSSEFNNRVYDLLFETCEHIIKDDMDPNFKDGTMKEDIIRIYEKYLVDGSVRTLDTVQSNFVYLSHVYCFMKMGLIERPKKEDLILMLKYMAEEELRRRQKPWDSSQTGKYITELLRIDIPKYLKKFDDLEKEEIKENKSEESKEIENKKTDLGEIVKLEIPTSDFLTGSTLSDLDEKQKQALTEYTSLFKLFSSELFEWIKYFYPEDEYKAEDYNSLSKIGINSSAKFICLYLQNQLHSHSSDRKNAFTSGRYSSPWNEDTAINYLEQIYIKTVMAEKNRREKSEQLKAAQTIKKEESSLSDLQIFARTTDMKEASRILDKGLTMVSFHYLQDILRSESPHNNFVLEKLLMLKSRGFMRDDQSKLIYYKKRFFRKLWKTYMSVYTYHEWKELWG